MIDEVYSYVVSSVRDIDSDLDPMLFNFETQKDSRLRIEKIFALNIGELQPTRLQTSYTALLPVTVSIFKKSSLYEQRNDFVDIYCKALRMQVNCCDQKRIAQTDFIKVVAPGVVSPLPLETDDNTITVTFTLDVTVNYF